MKSFPELIKEANDQINTVSVEELQSVIDDPNLILVDVQSKDAVEENGMIKNAIHATVVSWNFISIKEQIIHLRK